jgi:hypothetical protein
MGNFHAATRRNTIQVLCENTTVYKVDAEAIGQKVEQELVAKEKAKSNAKALPQKTRSSA